MTSYNDLLERCDGLRDDTDNLRGELDTANEQIDALEMRLATALLAKSENEGGES